jgi:hypothetical protein
VLLRPDRVNVRFFELVKHMCPDGEIGRRSGLKIRRPQGRGGSSPPLGTNKDAGLVNLGTPSISPPGNLGPSVGLKDSKRALSRAASRLVIASY